MRSSVIMCLVFAGGASSAAWAQNNGDIVFTDFTNDRVGLISGGVTSTLVAFGDPTTRLSGITRGPDGAFYVGNGPVPIQNPSTAGVFRIADLFGVPGVSNFAFSDPIQNPVGITYDAPSNHFLAIATPFNPVPQGIFRGINGINATTQAVNTVFTQPPTSDPRPRYEGGFYFAPVEGSSDHFVTSLNGGAFAGSGGDDDASTLWRLKVDPGTAVGTMTMVYDFSNAPGAPLTQIRGIAAVPGTNDVYVTDWATGGIYKLGLDAGGTSVLTVNQILAGLLAPEALAYNSFTGKLIVDQSDELGAFAQAKVFELNLDGTGLNEIASGFHARDFYIVPAPGTIALIGVGGLVALRRRRA